ncbi:MAG TPA: molybdopterin-dependent oxidoreductase, partial [Chloroflexota bacterium]
MKQQVAGRMREVRRLTCPHDCPDRCGLLAEVRDGKVVAVFGDPEHPVTRGVICRKVMEYPARIYGPDRILHPMKRVGPKGSGQFARISWEEAIDTIASRFAEIRDREGADSILRYAYGGTMGVVQRYGAASRFFNRLGAATHTRSICSAAGQ